MMAMGNEAERVDTIEVFQTLLDSTEVHVDIQHKVLTEITQVRCPLFAIPPSEPHLLLAFEAESHHPTLC